MSALESNTYIVLGLCGLVWLLVPLVNKTVKNWFNALPHMFLWDTVTALCFVCLGILCTIRLFVVYKTQNFNLDPSLDPRFLGLLLLLLALFYFGRAASRRRLEQEMEQ